MRRMLAVTGGGREDLPSPPFDLDNRGKRSVVLDLTDRTHGRDAMAALLAHRRRLPHQPPARRRRRASASTPSALLAAHPRLVYASVTGYGRAGPDAHRAGYDVGAFWARSGLAALAVPPDAAAAALPRRRRRPRHRHHDGGRHPRRPARAGADRAGPAGRDVACCAPASGASGGTWACGCASARCWRPQPRTEQGNPMVNVYRAGDGRWFWLLGVEGDRLWPKLLAGHRAARTWADDERFAHGAGPPARTPPS